MPASWPPSHTWEPIWGLGLGTALLTELVRGRSEVGGGFRKGRVLAPSLDPCSDFSSSVIEDTSETDGDDGSDSNLLKKQSNNNIIYMYYRKNQW